VRGEDLEGRLTGADMRHLSQVLSLAALLAVASTARAAPPATPAAAPGRPAAKPIADRDLGLSKASVFDVPTPPAWQDEASAPGDQPPPPRIGRETPPVVPHAVGDFLPITTAQNLCVDCHVLAGPKKKGDPTPVPASHFVDQRRSPGTAGGKVAGARWVCISCHLPRTDAPPLVGSTFKP
jgi:nitrate reductase (cytochrome), electron transfer subunit